MNKIFLIEFEPSLRISNKEFSTRFLKCLEGSDAVVYLYHEDFSYSIETKDLNKINLVELEKLGKILLCKEITLPNGFNL